jgi:hypothetical protein
MLGIIAENSLLILVVAAVLAGIFLYLVDHFKVYVMDGSRDPVRITSLRYLQIFVVLFTISMIFVLLALTGLVGWLSPGSPAILAPDQLATQAVETMETAAPGSSAGSTQLAPTIPVFTDTPPPPPSPTPAVTATIGNTGGAGANVRSIPGLDGTIIASADDGTTVIILEQTETKDGFTWQLVILPDGRQGWVVINYLIYNQ